MDHWVLAVYKEHVIWIIYTSYKILFASSNKQTAAEWSEVN